MNKFISFLLALALFSLVSSKRTCKKSILYSFGLTGRVRPNMINPLCPDITFNCCTKQDIMKIYKNYKSNVKNQMKI